MRSYALILTIVHLLLLCHCGRPNESQSNETYGKVNWQDNDLMDLAKNLKKTVQATVQLASAPINPWKNGFCTGTLVRYQGHDVLLTAGHCLEDQKECDETYLIADYEYIFGVENYLFNRYKCDKVLYTKVAGAVYDLAIATYKTVKTFDFPPPPEPITLEFGSLKPGQKLILSSHPSSLGHRRLAEILKKTQWTAEDYIDLDSYSMEKKTSTDCKVQQSNSLHTYHDCDTRSGSSGATIFSFPEGKFAGVHFLAGKFEPKAARQFNKGMSPAFVRRKLDKAVASLAVKKGE